MAEQLKFGKHPDTYSQAIIRLPNTTDPRLSFDEELLALAYFRNNLESVNYRNPTLEDRITELTHEDIMLLEKNGFRRGKKIFEADWARVDLKSRWAYFYWVNERNFDDKYASWQITEMVPDFPDRKRYQMVCIQTNSDRIEPGSYNKNSRFTTGLVTERELSELKQTLDKFKSEE